MTFLFYRIFYLIYTTGIKIFVLSFFYLCHFIFLCQWSDSVPAEHLRDKRSCYFIPHIFSIVCLISLPFALLYFKRHQNRRKEIQAATFFALSSDYFGSSITYTWGQSTHKIFFFVTSSFQPNKICFVQVKKEVEVYFDFLQMLRHCTTILFKVVVK